VATNHDVGSSNPSSPRALSPEDRKIMIGIADRRLWNLGVGLLSKCNGFTFSFYLLLI
jgi:hypothetical protein